MSNNKTSTITVRESIEVVEKAAGLIYSVIVSLSDDRADALDGAEAIHKDLLNNINRFYDQEGGK